MVYETVSLERTGTVLTVWLDRAEVRNAFNATMIDELTALFSELSARSDLRAVVLRGRGKSFSGGADINWMRASLEYSRDENLADALRMSDMFGAINALPIPVVAAVHGAALGGGMGLLAVCDVVIAADTTTFGFTEARLGIIPAVISRFVIPKVGESWTRALYLTAERFDAEVARRLGLVHWVVPAERLDETVRDKVRELLAGGPRAVREAKALIARARALAPEEMRSYTAERIAEQRTTEEGQEGLRAFLEKRGPSWMGEAEESGLK